MKALKNIILGLALASMLPIAAEAQNCASFLSMRKPEAPYRYNTASKSATCFSGKKYEFVLPLAAQTEYRIKFFASPVFNNEIQIKIVDLSDNKTIMDLPGKNDMDLRKGTTCLQDYTDATGKYIHPFFDVVTSQATSVKIMIDIKEHEATTPDEPVEQVKGCVTVYIADKPIEKDSSFE